jgi:tripartite-type tricarboxylate transporter receptor subunit TctC
VPCASATRGIPNAGIDHRPRDAAQSRGRSARSRVTSGKRHESFPDVPTLKELGCDVEYYLWIGLFAPKATPAPIIKVLRDATRQAVEDPTFRTALEKLSSPAAYQDADEFKPWLDADAARLADVIKKIGKVE